MRFPKLPAVSSVKLNLILSLYFTLAFNLGFFKEVLHFQPFNGNPNEYFILTMPFVMFAALNIIFNVVAIPLLHKIIIPLLILLSAAVSYNSLFFNIYFDVGMLDNVLETTPAESSRLITPAYLAWLLILGVLPAVLYILTPVAYHKWWKEIGFRLLSLFGSVVVIGGIAAVFYADHAQFFRNQRHIHYLIAPANFITSSVKKIRYIRSANMEFTQLGLDAAQAKKDNLRNVTVLVVGETTRAQNWGLNGYSRQTTPKLAARGEEVINFPNVSSCGTSTAVSVPCMFSVQTQDEYNALASQHQDNLMDMLQRAGVSSFWLNNNSNCKNVCNRIPSVDVIDLDLPEYCHNGECLDTLLLPELDKVLVEAEKKPNDIVVVLHTMGNHGPTYYERYTKEFRHFTPTCDTNKINECSKEELVNTYDNSVVFVDHLLDSVMKKLEQRSDWKGAVYYVSDHGESLGENGIYLHGAPYSIAPDFQTKVPMVMWFSKTWQQHSNYDLACVREKAKTQAFSHDNWFHTVLAINEIDPKFSLYKQELDILASCKK